MLDHLPGMVDDGDVLVFVNRVQRAEELAHRISASDLGVKIATLHGDLPPPQVREGDQGVGVG